MSKVSHKKKLTFSVFLNFLFLFFAILDPTRSIFHLTELVFVLFLLFNIKKIDYGYLPFILICFLTYFVSLAFSIDNQQFEKARELSLLTSYLFLFYLLFSKCNNKTFLYFYKIGLIMSFIVIVIGVFFLIFEKFAMIFIKYLADQKGTIMFTSARGFLSFTIIGVFYRTSPMITLLLPYALCRFFETHSKKYFFHSLIFLFNLLFSGTRANILSAILLVGFVYLFHLYFIKKSQFLFPCFFILGVSAAVVLIMKILFTKDASASVKDLHMESEWILFLKNPIRTFFVGYGPGSLFYTKAWNRLASQTELSYMELIRNYGLLGASCILIIYIYPIYRMLNTRKYSLMMRLSLTMGYLAYLFIAGTNPFLNCATGYLTVSIFYYMTNVNIKKEMTLYD